MNLRSSIHSCLEKRNSLTGWHSLDCTITVLFHSIPRKYVILKPFQLMQSRQSDDPPRRWCAAERVACARERYVELMPVLSRSQIAEFKRKGVLILPDFIDQAQLDDWRQQVRARPPALGHG
eukprot:COSAG02_NODE_1173_length_14105_cov_15.197701_9_plen_122_part_00